MRFSSVRPRANEPHLTRNSATLRFNADARFRLDAHLGVNHASAQRYFFTIDDLASARGADPALAFDGVSPETLASVLQSALREPDLWERWRAGQEDPDEVDPTTGATDPAATVTGSLAADRSEIKVTTTLPHAIVKHRLDLLIGHNWKLRDVS